MRLCYCIAVEFDGIDDTFDKIEHWGGFVCWHDDGVIPPKPYRLDGGFRVLSDGRVLRTCSFLLDATNPGIQEEEEIGFEILVSGPCHIPSNPFASNCCCIGGAQSNDFPTPSSSSSSSSSPSMLEAVELFTDTGLAVFSGDASRVDQETLSLADEEAVAWIEVVDKELARRGLDGQSSFQFSEIASRHSHRYDLIVPTKESNLDQSHQGFSLSFSTIHQLARDGPWTPFIRALLRIKKEDGQDDVCAGLHCDVSVVYSRPGSTIQGVHSDGPHIGRAQVWESLKDSQAEPYGACVFVPLMDLDDTVGYTQFWSHTHKHPGLIGLGEAGDVLEATYNAVVEAGSSVVYDYRLLHRGMENNSQNTERRILQFFYHTDLYMEGRNYGKESVFS